MIKKVLLTIFFNVIFLSVFICKNGYVAKAGKKGRGIFAKKNLRPGDILEVSPYIEIPPKDYKRLGDSIIELYRFEVKGKRCALGLGYTSLYNHSEENNADFSLNKKTKTIRIKVLKSVRRGEEVTINYGYEVDE